VPDDPLLFCAPPPPNRLDPGVAEVLAGFPPPKRVPEVFWLGVVDPKSEPVELPLVAGVPKLKVGRDLEVLFDMTDRRRSGMGTSDHGFAPINALLLYAVQYRNADSCCNTPCSCTPTSIGIPVWSKIAIW
jgi:hypothetical protein